MWPLIKRLSLGLFLIAAAGAVLLVSDRRHWSGEKKTRMVRLAIFQFSSRDLLNDSVNGCLDALKEHGFQPGKNITIERFCADNDLTTANTISKNIVEGGFDLAITFSTPSLQCLANANREGKIIHVFGTVTDPYRSGVGLDRQNPAIRPKHLAGIGTFQPVKELWQLAKKINPQLNNVGEVWCQSETCSEACTLLARESARARGMTLMEAPIISLSELPDALTSLLARKAQAIWIGGDNIVESAVPSVVQPALRSGVPVIANAATHVNSGALLGLGADYYEVGRATGNIAAEIIKGRDPVSFPIANVAPMKLAVNYEVLPGLREPWNIPEDILRARIETACAEMGIQKPERSGYAPPAAGGLPVQTNAIASARPAKKWNIHILHYAESTAAEDCEKGFLDGLKNTGLAEGRDYTIKIRNAQGQLINLATMFDAAQAEGADLFIITSTPTLQIAVQKIKDKPVLFTLVANPALAGPGLDFTNHLPNITGISTMSDYAGMAGILRECMPNARRVGTLYADNEDNAVFNKEQTAAALQKAGIQLDAIGISTQAEIADAAKALTERDIDGICQVAANIIDASFSAITLAARQTKKPLFGFMPGQAIKSGAAVVVARDYEQSGRDLAGLAARVMQGENPAQIPITLTSRTLLIVNPANAGLCGLKLPESVLKRADRIVEK